MHQYWYDLRVNKLENLLPSWLIDNEYYTQVTQALTQNQYSKTRDVVAKIF